MSWIVSRAAWRSLVVAAVRDPPDRCRWLDSLLPSPSSAELAIVGVGGGV